MNKDVIYIDVEDDITAIIGKIKASKENIIALVPPKHVGILQSAVNLRLLDRMASSSRKRLVLITNNQALIGLSAVAGIPVAKNLQSKPELAEISALSVDEGDDVIDGAQLPVGELAKTARKSAPSDVVSDKELNTINIDDDAVSVAALSEAVKKPNAFNSAAKAGKSMKVPNFTSFRKKLFIAIAALVALIVFLVWAFVFAPAATVIITARTTPEPVSTTATLGGDVTSDTTKGIIKSITQQTKNDVSVDFTATGQKNIGNKATGTANLSQQSLTATQIPAGTQLTTTGGLVFTTDSAVTVPKSDTTSLSCFPTACPGTATVPVTAAEGGVNYNGASGSLSGAPSPVTARLASPTAGGTDNIVTVVTADDIQKATAQLSQQSSDTVKQQLTKQFTSDQIAIPDSFTVSAGTPVSTPAVDTQSSDGKAKLTATTTYTLTGIAKSDIEQFLKDTLNKQLAGSANQRVYDDGISKVQLTGYNKAADGTTTVKIMSTGQIGPSIDEAKVKEQVKGKIFGDVQSTLSEIPGVDNVDIRFSYPWVRNVPNDVKKITIQFKVQNA